MAADRTMTADRRKTTNPWTRTISRRVWGFSMRDGGDAGADGAGRRRNPEPDEDGWCTVPTTKMKERLMTRERRAREKRARVASNDYREAANGV